MSVKSQFTIPSGIDDPDTLRRVLVQIVNELDRLSSKHDFGELIMDPGSSDDVKSLADTLNGMRNE
jgi:hypothetical protein